MNKEEQKKLLIETMQADEKDGLYRQQTALNWFLDHLPKRIQIALINTSVDVIKQARQMEKEQIIEFGRKVADHWGMTEVPKEYIEQYYNKTYGK